MRSLSLLLALLAAGCLVAAGYLYVMDHSPVPEFTVSPTEFDLEMVPPGDHECVVRVTNPAAVPRRIIGLAEG